MDQELALEILKSGHNVLLTGSAGTGKTYVLNQFITHLRSHGVKHAVTASTGLAATHLGGVTIHSWAKIGIRDRLPSNFTQKLAAKDKERLQHTSVLIIDEISMLHDYRLDMIDEVLRKVRKSERPFGGMQVILCGDFFQLPPVNGRGDERSGGFAVNADVWSKGEFVTCYLEKSYRQLGDADFNEILNAIRFQDVRRRHAEALLGRVTGLPEDIQNMTQLFVTNYDTGRINQQELAKLGTKTLTYIQNTSGKKQYVESLAKACLAEEVLRLKVGARVMFVRNNPVKGYINGTLGLVVDFTKGDDEPLPMIRTLQGRMIIAERETWELSNDDESPPKARISQIPLRLAWAITVHKSQGMTLDSAHIDLSKAFVEGMGYVALSRVRNLENLTLQGINKMALRVAPEALTIDIELRSRSADAVSQKEQLTIQPPPYTLHKPIKVSQVNESKSEEKSNKKGPNGGPSLDEIRKKFPKAYTPWEDAEDQALLRGYNKGLKTKVLAIAHGRQPGSIASRLKKLLNTEVVKIKK